MSRIKHCIFIIDNDDTKKRKALEDEKKLLKEIKNLEDNFAPENTEALKDRQEELRKLRETKLRGALIRSRAKWILDGEKPSKYFLNLENPNFTSKLMKKTSHLSK